MKKYIILIITYLAITLPASAIIVEQLGIYDTYQIAPDVGNTKVNPKGSQVIKIDRKEGYFIDGRNQVPEYSQILPPNPDKIPQTSHPTRTIEPFESYYDRNIKGERRSEYMTPIIPNYNRHYSERRHTPYTRKEYMDVWCVGEKDYDKGLCISENYYTYFIRARNWTWGITQTPFQVNKAKQLGKTPALFVMIDDLGLDAKNAHDIKETAELFNINIFFGTIDSAIPNSWIPE